MVAAEWLGAFNAAYRQVLHVGSLLDWNYNTNLTDENARLLSDYGAWRTSYMRPWRSQAKLFQLDVLPSEISRQIQIVGRSSSCLTPKKSQ